MPPRNPPTPRDKREELKTYSELKLGRELKSIPKRKKVEANGLKRVLGTGSSTQPYLIVDAKRYRQVRLEIQRQLLNEAKENGINLSVDLLLDQIKPRLEALVYIQLADEISRDAEAHLPVLTLGRSLTPEERAQFAASYSMEETPFEPCYPTSSAKRALNQVLRHIEQRQDHNPARYQAIWAELVGSDAAQQSHLDHIDPATQTAWFRCTNSTLSYSLSRQPALAKNLSKALGLPIRQLRARF